MRKYCFFIFVFFLTYTLGAQQRHALVIAIGNYPEAGGWPKISSESDVPFVKRALQQWQFQEAEIQVLQNEKATKAGIKTALDNLYGKLQPGDVVVIHISSHGEQIEDDNRDETDGLDEAIVCFDAVSPSRSKNFSKDTGGYFRDDLFGNYILKFRSRLGASGDLVVFMDACHSGTGTRGVARTRGGQPPLVSANFKKPQHVRSDTSGVFEERNQIAENALSPYVIISAARAEEFAFEVTNENNQSMGSLSYALSKSLELTNPQLTYQGLFGKIQSELNLKVQGQHPVLEGTGVNRKLFGGNFVAQKNYYGIRKIIDKQNIEANGGIYSGLTPNTMVGLFPPNTPDAASAIPLDTGWVISASPFKSTIKLKKGGLKSTGEVWIFTLQAAYTKEPIVLELKSVKTGKKISGFSAAEMQEVQTGLKEMNLVKFSGRPELTLRKGRDRDSLVISNNGFVFTTIKRQADYLPVLKSALEQYAQFRYLMGLKLEDSGAAVQVDLVPAIHNSPDTSRVGSNYRRGSMVCPVGSTYMLRVRNPGKKHVFVNILDMQPDGWINPVLPNAAKGLYPDQCKIEAGGERIYTEYLIQISPPLGTEVFKIFVSSTEIDLEKLATIDLRGARGGNFENVIETLVANARLATRGASTVKIGSASGSVQDLVFEIVP